MNSAKRFALNAIRRLLSGEKATAFSFQPSVRTELPQFDGPQDFYVHVPYCQKRCAYCPYNTKPLDTEETPRFYEALKAEAHLAAANGASASGRSLYIGGGTPTCTGHRLVRFIEDFSALCGSPATIAIESSAEEITGAFLDKLRCVGVTQLSVGIQSFDPKTLKRLGRSGETETYEGKIALAAEMGFKNLNVDLMYDADGETIEEVDRDLNRAIGSGADQITVYPLFRFFREEGVAMPSLRGRWRFFDFVWQKMVSEGYAPVSVWSFRRGCSGEVFSSVQRRSFVGLGPGAATCQRSLFAFNTFDASAWMGKINQRECAYSLEMTLSPNIRALYGLYWDLYACRMPDKLDMDLKKRRTLQAFASVARILGFLRGTSLTEKGAYWIHLLQNQYMLDYINRLWYVSRRTPYPSQVHL